MSQILGERWASLVFALRTLSTPHQELGGDIVHSEGGSVAIDYSYLFELTMHQETGPVVWPSYLSRGLAVHRAHRFSGLCLLLGCLAALQNVVLGVVAQAARVHDWKNISLELASCNN